MKRNYEFRKKQKSNQITNQTDEPRSNARKRRSLSSVANRTSCEPLTAPLILIKIDDWWLRLMIKIEIRLRISLRLMIDDWLFATMRKYENSTNPASTSNHKTKFNQKILKSIITNDTGGDTHCAREIECRICRWYSASTKQTLTQQFSYYCYIFKK